jgi:ammonium transporter, Amt family
MIKRYFNRVALAAAGALLATPAWAQDAPTFNNGDITWMMVSTLLVLMMAVPGLALFYGGLVRSKNMLSVLTQVLAIVCTVGVIWFIYGYSMAFTAGSPYVGGFGKLFLSSVTATSPAATFSNGIYIPEFVFIVFQMTFACITAALIVGAFAERIKFSALMIFVILWVTLVYFPIAHMVWYWDGPDALAAAAKEGQAAIDAVNANAGQIFQWGALDFAGGTVVHINAGIAGLVGCIMIGKRIGYGKEALTPHSLTLTMVGAALLWVGWFGFNAGSNLEANYVAVLAFINTMSATVAAGLTWMLVEWIAKGKPSLLGLASGVVAGLVAVTPASGWGGPVGCMALGAVASIVCFFFCTTIKNKLGYDDSLDVFGIHAVGGIIGALGTGILVNPALGGAGIPDYTSQPGTLVVGAYDFGFQMMAQLKGVLLTIVWSGVISAILYFIIDKTIGLRVSADKEREGLDLSEHGERAYN